MTYIGSAHKSASDTVWTHLVHVRVIQLKLLTAGDSVENAKSSEKTMSTYGAEGWLKTFSVRALSPTSRSLCGFLLAYLLP